MQIHWSAKAFAELKSLHTALAGAALANDIVTRLANAPDALLLQPRQGQRLKGYSGREIRRLRLGRYALDYGIQRDRIDVLHVGLDPEAPQ